MAVVTGSSTSGVGLACARAFASAGANVLNGIGAPAEVEKERDRDIAPRRNEGAWCCLAASSCTLIKIKRSSIRSAIVDCK
jgi:NAD(P)-dependent dehydrogenase (short-subunit alcohol dehydrogenase family)